MVQSWESFALFPWRLQWLHIGTGAILHLLALSTLFFGWYQIMHRLSGSRDWRRDFEVYSLSVLARRIPTLVWYIGERIYLYKKHQVSPVTVLSATGLETLLITASGLICYLSLLPWYSYTRGIWQVGTACLLTFLIGSLLLRPTLLIDVGNKFLHLIGRPSLSVVVSRKDVAVLIAIYLATWFLDGFSLYLVISAFMTKTPPLFDVLGISTISALISILALILPAGFWLKELTMSALLGTWMPLSVGLVVSLSYRLMHTFLEMLWAFAGYYVGRFSETP